MFTFSRGHVTNKRGSAIKYLRFCEAMLTILELVAAYEKGSPLTLVTGNNRRVTNRKSYISIFTWIMNTKLDKVMAYGIEPPCTKWYDSLIT